MIVYFSRVTALILAVILILGTIVLPVKAMRAEETEITLIETPGISEETVHAVLQGLDNSTIAACAAAGCTAVVVLIVWKQKEL